MFLFESFTYNDKWASQYYEDFYNASDYFAKYLNDNCPFNNIKYTVRRCWTKDHSNNKYEVAYVNKSDLFNTFAHKKYFAYMYDKLEQYGNCININPTQSISTLVFIYDIKTDETRWNYEQDKHKIAYKTDEIVNCKPTLEQWIYMINAKFEKKNPNILFSKEKTIEGIAAKYIIAIKLNWTDAIDAAFNKLSELLVNTEKYSSMFKKFITSYANEVYEIDPEIQELINDFKDANKDVSKISIPNQMRKIAKVINEDPYVKKYQYKGSGEFQILTTNENVGVFYIIEDTQLGHGFYKIVLHLKGESFTNDKKSASYKFNALDSTVSSAIRAIYKNDSEELDKIIIKVNKI